MCHVNWASQLTPHATASVTIVHGHQHRQLVFQAEFIPLPYPCPKPNSTSVFNTYQASGEPKVFANSEQPTLPVSTRNTNQPRQAHW